ncbi:MULTISPECIES: hypothetical protein [Streptomyces]|uniref:Small CPxCG-related zinc finger protein n=1 Tax=Streptomyces caniscabiei TaxID=2746961 RepID=A0ABU4MNF5_9ACTN|nr:MULTISPECIES: hypothetical protein [Streptomyces]MBE4734390.1 hypothetical protein [Streptomyces caniscabiei]MBE4755261.1 hypothetical protein [Streptomyces caniscabiei]MBE4771341.1 hypothetical protein [Streptomyces caniscabiei]MBE4783454.1 hypothetical protein [Streptomyces caniscabiei]MBE4792758.1 hypothetical protein [Streptomyces caniscabiei]
MSDDYCGGGGGTAATPDPARALATEAADGPPFAECVLCRQPTEYPESHKGITLCPVCEWREAERAACSG